ncbi:MAG: LysR family transcriptional regulator [Erysipelotrichaceae bacterium]|nr:LysR family transcriptional regulator [Erysipelotrichaceae bacterium]
MELYQLQQFYTIANSRTMSEAAKKLHISQPALSASLKKLEDELGIQLFDRYKNKIKLNDAGKIVLKHCENIFFSIDKIKEDVESYITQNTMIKIGFDDPGPMWYIVPNLSMAYGLDRIKNELYDQDTLSLLLNHTYDLAVCSQNIQYSNVVSYHLVEERMYLSVPNGYMYSDKEEIDMFKDRIESMIHYITDFNGMHNRLMQPFWDELSKYTQVKDINDYFIFNQIVHNEDVYTTTTKIVRHYRDDGDDRKLVLINNKETISNYYLVYLKDHEDELKEYIEFIKYIMKNL